MGPLSRTGRALAIRDEDRNQFNQLLSILTLAGSADSAPVAIADKDGVMIDGVTFGVFKSLMLGLATHYQMIWAEFKKPVEE